MSGHPRGSRDELGRIVGPMVGLVALEFLLGMGLNLFGDLPSHPAAGELLADPLLFVHVLVGVLLVGITARATALAVRGPRRSAVPPAVLGVVSAVGAFVAGLDFTFAGLSATASFAMAAGFLGIVVSAVGLLWATAVGPAVAAEGERAR